MDTIKIDESIKKLSTHKDKWAALPITEKIELLKQVLKNLGDNTKSWVDISICNKHIESDSPWVGEEWTAGIWALAAGLNGYIETLSGLVNGHKPQFKKIRNGSGDRTILRIYPNNLIESLLLHGITADVWMKEGVTGENLDDHCAGFYKGKNPKGKVALVLGAGNANSIASLDMLYRLIAHGQVVLLKLNPVNEYLGPILEKIFEPFVSAGYIQFVYGSADVGHYLVHHPEISEIHITGSSRTHDTIVFGMGEEGERNKELHNPILNKPITSELGGISPVIVVPGNWSETDIRFQAERIVTMKMHNCGFNCIAAQVLILPEKWKLKDTLLDAIRSVLKELPVRRAWYPGAAERQKAAFASHHLVETYGGGEVPSTLIVDIASDNVNESSFNEEFFCAVLAQTTLSGDGPEEFLKNAVAFCNERLHGTLGANIIIHPKTIKESGKVLEQAVADMHYGSIGINVWSAVAFLLPQAPWGAYPDHTLNDVQSGIGVVHNSFLLEETEKTVVKGSFYPFPRSVLHFDFSMLPKPPWFVTNKTAHVTARRFAQFTIDRNPALIPGIFASALRG
ncbi:MAG: aldehyde dehydrogenase [Candidatus Latescibacteria bacterium]|nr:aldehyde dehydrogenase [Candidatus Latescibacterota bacterium]